MSRRYGMTIDVNRCVGCQTCTVACKHSNDTLPEVQWRRVLDVETGTYPDVQRLFLVTGCQHCADPPCVPVCPTGATFQRDDGLVAMDYDICIGCGYCAVSCPYQARTIVHDQAWFYGQPTRQEEAVKHDERIGVAQKCSFCIEKIDQALVENKIPGLHLDVTPVCSASCIAQAIQFGDFNDEQSVVSQLVAERPHFQMHEELGTDPQIKYLYATPAVPGQTGGALTEDHDNPANALTGPLQTFWDIRAASNFTFGGFGAGLIGMAWIVNSFTGLSSGLQNFAYVFGAFLIAFGLFCVFLEIGRKARFLHALKRPGTSWMSREIYVVVMLFIATAVAWYTAPQSDIPVPKSGGGWNHAAGMLALAFLYCQAKILNAAKGIPAWRVRAIPNLLISSALVEGCGLLVMAACYVQLTDPRAENVPVIRFICLIGFAAAIHFAFSWRRFVRYAHLDGVTPLAVQALKQASPLVHLVAHFVPIGLLCASYVVPNVHPIIYGLGGLAACAGGIIWRLLLITKASHQQGFSLPQRPKRGSGTMAAPRREGRDGPFAATAD